MSKNKLDGKIISCDGNGWFRVDVENLKQPVLCRLAGKMNKHKIKVVEGDRVEIEVDITDLTLGRITYRRR